MDKTKLSLGDRFDDWLIAHHWWARGKPLPERHRKPELTRWERLERFNNAIERVQRWTGSRDLKSRWWEREHKRVEAKSRERRIGEQQRKHAAVARRREALGNLDTHLSNVERELRSIEFLLLVILIVLLVHFC